MWSSWSSSWSSSWPRHSHVTTKTKPVTHGGATHAGTTYTFTPRFPLVLPVLEIRRAFTLVPGTDTHTMCLMLLNRVGSLTAPAMQQDERSSSGGGDVKPFRYATTPMLCHLSFRRSKPRSWWWGRGVGLPQCIPFKVLLVLSFEGVLLIICAMTPSMGIDDGGFRQKRRCRSFHNSFLASEALCTALAGTLVFNLILIL